MNASPTTEERIWAVLSHLSALALGMGILLPIICWSEQRRKSKYASFQCLQALGYQSLGYTFWLLVYLLVLIGILITAIIMSFRAEQTGQPLNPMTGTPVKLINFAILGFFVLYMIFPIVAAIACGLGREFRYPILGHRLAKYLGYVENNDSEWLIEKHEDHWVVAMGHFSVIIFLWGLIAPFTTWVTQGKRSLFLKFQSIQTLMYQGIVTVLFFAGLFLFLIGFAALMISDPFGSSSGYGSLLGMGIFFVLSLIAVVILLVIPFFHILGQWAGYRVLKGDNYNYPFVGKFVERWTTKS